MNVISVNGFSFAYPDGKERLHHINLSVKEGEFAVLCGPSGSGKTTLLRCMKPEIAPTGERKGEVTALPAAEAGFVFQNPDNQIVTDTVRHELAFGLENMGLPSGVIRRRVAETALFFGIDEWIDASVHEISGGQKQLLNLAAVIAMRPKLLLLDEPVSQLDPSARKNFLELLVRVNRELGIAVLLSEHHLEEILPLADRVYYLENGSLVYEGTSTDYAKEVLTKGSAYSKTLPAAARIAHAVSTHAVQENEKTRGKETGKNIEIDTRTAIEKEISYPLTVRDGRRFVEEHVSWFTAEKDAVLRQFLPPDGQRSPEKPGGEETISKTDDTQNLCIHVEHIWFQYQRQTPYVLKGLELRIHKGCFHAILGGNGSGKSTLLAVLGKRIYANRGKIRLGKDKHMPSIGLLTQNPKAMFCRDTVKEELETGGCPDALTEELELLSLKDQHPYDLSGGEQQRLGLALVLAKEPELLLLDEPAKGMDIEARERLGQYLRAYASKGNAVLCVTHDVEFASRYADVCSLLFEGEVLSTDETDTFFKENAFYTTDAVRVLRGFF